MPQVYINGAYCGAMRVGFGVVMIGRTLDSWELVFFFFLF